MSSNALVGVTSRQVELVECVCDVEMLARDGVKLVMDIWFPSGVTPEASYPVVVERTPYGRSNPRLQRLGEVLAARGIVVVLQDVRGRGSSGGRFHLMMNHPDEGMDGADTLAWVHQQRWCNGRIGTMGLSFTAANQHATALNHPKGLVAQVQIDSGTNYFLRMFRYHGAANIGVALPWVLTFGEQVAPDKASADALARMRANVGEWIDELPLVRGETPISVIPEYEDIYFKILETSDFTDYWRNPTIYLEGRWDEYPHDIALLLVSGWFSHHGTANLEKFRELGQRLDGPVRLIIGPWTHGEPMLAISTAGDADFGPAALAFGTGEQLRAEWFDTHLVGSASAACEESRLDYFVMGGGDGHLTSEGRIFHGGEWRTASAWPLPDTVFTPYYLGAGGVLERASPAGEAQPSRFVFDPDDPCPCIGGVNVAVDHMPDFVLPGPRLQTCRPSFVACKGGAGRLADRDDVLVFRSDVLDQAIEVTGPIIVRLFVASSAPDTDFHVRLIDEYPGSDSSQGPELMLTEGILRMRYRDRRDIGELIEPGRIYEVSVELGSTSNLFNKGHRIVLHVTSSAFPQYDVNPNTGEPLGKHSYKMVARQSVFHDRVHPSALILPLQVKA